MLSNLVTGSDVKVNTKASGTTATAATATATANANAQPAVADISVPTVIKRQTTVDAIAGTTESETKCAEIVQLCAAASCKFVDDSFVPGKTCGGQ